MALDRIARRPLPPLTDDEWAVLRAEVEAAWDAGEKVVKLDRSHGHVVVKGQQREPIYRVARD